VLDVKNYVPNLIKRRIQKEFK